MKKGLVMAAQQGKRRAGGGGNLLKSWDDSKSECEMGYFCFVGSKSVRVDVSCLSVFPWRGRDSNIKYMLTL